MFTIEIVTPMNIDSSKISAINLAGKKEYEKNLLKNEITKQFDLNYLSTGIYVLMIVDKEIYIT